MRFAFLGIIVIDYIPKKKKRGGKKMKLNRFWGIIWWLCVMGYLIQGGAFKEMKSFDVFAFIFIFILMLIDDIFFSHRGKIFTFIMVVIPILIWFYISYNYVDGSLFKLILADMGLRQ